VTGRLTKMVAGSLAVAAVVVSPAALAFSSAYAAPSTPAAVNSLVIRSIDTRNYATDGKVSVVVETDLQSTVGGVVTLNGVPAQNPSLATTADAKSTDPAHANQAAVPTGVVFVVDSSKAMGDGEAMAKVTDALAKVAQLRQPNQAMALITYGFQSRVVSDFTTDPAAFTAAAASLTADGRADAAPWDGLQGALDLFQKRPDLQPNIVFISASADSDSANSLAAVRGDVINAGAEFSAISLTRPDVDASALADLAGATHGKFVALNNPADVAGALNTDFVRLSNQRLITGTGPKGADSLDVKVTLGPMSSTAHVLTGSLVSGSALTPKFTAASTGDSGFLHGKSMKTIGALLVLVAVVLFALGLGSMIVRDDSGLEKVLSHYGEDSVLGGDVYEGDGLNQTMVQSKLIGRAVEFTSEMASRRGVLQWLERSLELADLPLRAGEAFFFYLASAFLIAAATLVLVGNIMMTLLLVGVITALPPMLLKTICSRRRSKFISQLPDMLTLMASTLKAGYSLMQGVEAVSQEVQDPMGKELRRIVVEARLGRPLEEAMGDAADRMDSLDFNWAIMAITIQREVGGNLAELLLTVAETMTERERLRRDVKSLTAEGRMSAIVLGLLPPGLGVVMYGMNPAYIKVLFTDPTGQKLLGLAVVMIIAGILWMRKMVQVDV
jgi:tight adherence protein B